jgi:hypothetical protein
VATTIARPTIAPVFNVFPTTHQLKYGVLIMDHLEKSELKKELSIEIKKDVFSEVCSKLLHASAFMLIEVFIWITVISMAVKGASFNRAYWTCYLLLGVRALQALMYYWFRHP